MVENNSKNNNIEMKRKVVTYRTRASKKNSVYIQHNMITINEIFSHSIFFILTPFFLRIAFRMPWERVAWLSRNVKNSLFLSAFVRKFPSHRARISRSHSKKAHDDIHLFSLKLHNQTSSSSSYKREKFSA